MSAVPDISVLIVNYNGREKLRTCLQSILDTKENLAVEVLVSDNGSRDGSIRMVKEDYPDVVLVENHENLGFGKANNIALPLCRSEHILLFNPDTALTPGALRTMLEFMKAHPDAAAIGPKLTNIDGSLQRSIRRFPSLINQLSESLFLYRFSRRGSGEVIEDPESYAQSREVDWVTGAAMLVRKEAFDSIGGFDERFFLYSEETDWCARAKTGGWKIFFFPGAKVMHIHGDSGVNPQLHLQLLRSKFIYFDKHFPLWQQPLLKLAVVLGLLIRIVLSFIAALVQGFRGERAVGKLRVSWFALLGLVAGHSIVVSSGPPIKR